MDQIILKDLEVFYRVGVTEEERGQPQRLLLTVEMEHSFAAVAQSDDLEQTINYHTLAQRLLRFGEGRSWSLIETAAVEIAGMVLLEFGPQKVNVEVKKFVLREAGYVAVRVSRARGK
jgi:7,8-dihydroneopterin aldolase/epimerase/oxygenase